MFCSNARENKRAAVALQEMHAEKNNCSSAPVNIAAANVNTFRLNKSQICF